ncbi:MAG: hypothetical protein DHS20C16_27060 [Phycisphaerae bacterium]|nr:MAG: hypothetical protein DHS20C16_27060 [Phycisphaerae bacterium]
MLVTSKMERSLRFIELIRMPLGLRAILTFRLSSVVVRGFGASCNVRCLADKLTLKIIDSMGDVRLASLRAHCLSGAKR